MFSGGIERDHWHDMAYDYTDILLCGSRNTVVTKLFPNFVLEKIKINGVTFDFTLTWEICPALPHSRIQ